MYVKCVKYGEKSKLNIAKEDLPQRDKSALCWHDLPTFYHTNA